jgi:hypothetical protein
MLNKSKNSNHLLNIPARRLPELPLVFPAQLRRAVITHRKGHRFRAFIFCQHEPLRLIQTQPFLKLEGVRACNPAFVSLNGFHIPPFLPGRELFQNKFSPMALSKRGPRASALYTGHKHPINTMFQAEFGNFA